MCKRVSVCLCVCACVCDTSVCDACGDQKTSEHLGLEVQVLVAIHPTELLGNEFMSCRRAVPTPSYLFICSSLP